MISHTWSAGLEDGKKPPGIPTQNYTNNNTLNCVLGGGTYSSGGRSKLPEKIGYFLSMFSFLFSLGDFVL